MQPISNLLQKLKEESRLRIIPDEGYDKRIDLLSNDYLGLAQHANEFREEFSERFSDASFTSSASRLLQRNQKYHNMLEGLLAELYGHPAMLFNSGYHANVGCLSALASLPYTLIVSDKLIHASAIDGIRLGKADVKRFPHNDSKTLRKILEKNSGKYDLIVVVVESVYSMDGDLADLHRLVELKREFEGVFLYVDEAHGFGVFGKQGLGLCEAEGVIDDIDIIVGTLGKAAASAGAFIVCSDELRQYMLNTARSFIFSTALPPAQQAWSILMIEKILNMRSERQRLAFLGKVFKEEIQKLTGVENPSQSQIVPLIAGSAEKALNWADRLRKSGYDCLAIRRPTVAAGTERLRFSLNSSLTESDIQNIIGVLKKIIV
ncbi:MAG: 8-amino-7-oxononanoate synthase [Clostridium sp.]|nr:8-amino-7-oxononanoate synthase [Prevotella sp.]MCM1428286.1 8-amino-7-oxononanoate synthase [Clostridium sp.]MCM1476240.1 8-amino-7-oxononanoate synthase [Muribaculaceae bacterium]